MDPNLIGLGIALGVGLLVGMEREWADEKPIGLRSFALIGLSGGLLALLAETLGAWPLAAGLIAVGALLAVKMRAESGTTTSIAALVVLMLGATAVAGLWLHTIVAAGVVTLLLHWKEPLHGWINRLGGNDFEIIARFVLLAAVILPVLPDRTYGPYDVFNPFQAWLLVVLIVGINLLGYVALRLFGTNRGVWLAGVFGGLISSTATTVSYAVASRKTERFGLPATIVILLASTIIYARIGFELFVVAPDLIGELIYPSAIFSVMMLGLCGVAFLLMRRAATTVSYPESGNPARVRAAIGFAVVYVVILFAVAAARDRIGSQAIYGVALVSGLTDVDALTLSVGQLYAREKLDADIAWRAIFLATLANLAFKCGAATVLGSRDLRIHILSFIAVALAVGSSILWLWP